MRNPLYDWIGVTLAFVIAAVITLMARRIADARIDEAIKLRTTITVTSSEGIEVGKEIQLGNTRMMVMAIEGNTLTVVKV